MIGRVAAALTLLAFLALAGGAEARQKIILTEDEAFKHHVETPVAEPAVVAPAGALALDRWVTSSAARLDRLHSPLLSRPTLFEHLNHPEQQIAARAQQSLNCTICETLYAALEPKLFTNATEALVITVANLICDLMKPLCHSPDACKQVCTGIIGEYQPVVWTLAPELLTPAFVCYKLNQCPAPAPPVPSTDIPVPSNLQNYAGEIEWPSWRLTEGTGTFLHLSDGHIDPTYTVGALAACPLPVCCHETDGPGTGSNDTAGFWGDHRCDTTPQLAQNLLEFIAQMQPQPDFIIYTGDDPAHDVWKQSRVENLAALNLWTQLVNDTVAGPNQIPVFSALGNHEIFPINQFAGPGYDSWMYDAAVSAWAPYLPEDAQATMAYGGYYQARVRPGLRVIALNSNYFTNDNFWLLANMTDAWDQVNWAADVLRQMSELNEKAIVICHAPLANWKTEIAAAFLQMAEKYQNVIVNYFMGHTHYNEYQAVHSSSGVPTHVAYVGGSVVPYSFVNPGFFEYSYDRAAVANNESFAYLVQRAVGHWIDLEQANAQNDTFAQWPVAQYDMAAALGVPSLDPASLAALSPQYVTNATLYGAYSRAQYKGLVVQSPSSAQDVKCFTGSNTAADYHTCMHAQGLGEEHIRASDAAKEANC